MGSSRIAALAFSCFVSCFLSCSSDDDDEAFAVQSAVSFPPPLVHDVGGALVGTLPGTFAVTSDGAASYTIPIDVAPGRAGMEPSLSLSYSSRNGNGHLGVGWQLSGMSEVRRCGANLRLDGGFHAVHFDDSDRYCLDGKELVATSGYDGANGTTYVTEPDTFSKIVSAHASTDACGKATSSAHEPTSFTVYAKDGRSYEYGTTCDALGIAMEHPLLDTAGNHGAVLRRFAWELKTVRDRSGNYMTYNYVKAGWAPDAGLDQLSGYESRISSIDYTGSTAASVPTSQRAPLRHVTFAYEGRGDATLGYMHGLQLFRAARLRSISVQAPGQPAGQAFLRSYWLAYDQAPITGKSRLVSVQACDAWGANASGITDATQCLPATKLTYSNMSTPAFATPITLGGENIDTTFPTYNTRLFTAADFNNDGHDDLIYKSNATNTLLVRPGTGGGPGAATNTGIGQPWGNGRAAPILIYDATGNGSTDIVEQDEMDVCEGCDPNDPSEITKPTYRINVHNSTSTGSTISFGSGYSLGSDFGHWQYHELGLQLFDLDGDGVPELRWNREKATGFPPKYNGGDTDTIRYSDGSVSSSDVNTSTPSAAPKPFILVDLDGDGVPETISGGPWGDPTHATTHWSATRSDSWITNLQSDTECVVFADLNGDGLADAVNVKSFNGVNHSFVQLSYGNGEFSAPIAIATPHFQGLSCSGYNDAGVRVVDWDRDGRQDLLLLGRTKLNGGAAYVLTWTGSNFAETVIPGISLVGNVGDDWTAPVPMQVDTPGAVVADFDGDGTFDIAMNGGSYIQVYMQSWRLPDLLVSVTDGTGRLVRTVQYDTLHVGSSYTPGTTRGATQRMDQPRMPVVRKEYFPLVQGGGASPGAENSPWGEVDHSYAGALTDTHGDGWLGFAKHTIHDGRDNSYHTTTYSQELRNYSPLSTDRYPFKLLPIEEVSTVRAGSTTLATRTTTSWGWHTRTVHNPVTGADRLVHFPYPSLVGTQQYDSASLSLTAPDFSNVSPYRATTKYTFGIDDLGNVTREAVDEGGVGLVYTLTSRSFGQEDTNAWLIGRVTQECVNNTSVGAIPIDPCAPSADATKNVTRKTTFGYAPGTRLVQDTVRQPGTPDARSSHVTFDPFGQAAQVDVTANVRTCPNTIAAQTRTTAVTYDTTTDSVAITSQSQRRDASTVFATIVHADPATSLVYGLEDPNGAATIQQYDGLGRPYKTIAADGATATITRGVSGTSLWTQTDRGVDGASIVYTDRVGHVVRSATKLKDGAFAYTDAFYDALGRLDHVRRPYYATDTARYTAFTNVYDFNASRLAQVCHPTEAATSVCTTFSYGLDASSQRAVTTTDEDGDVTRVVTSGAGRTVSTSTFPDAIAKGSGPAVTTTYSYGPFGLLATVTDPAQHVQARTYDALGRRLTFDDPDSGHVTDTYNGFDELDTETDATNTTTCIEHDRLGRVSRRVAPDGTDQLAYDSAPGGGKGRLATKTRGSISTSYAYTAIGQIQNETWLVDGDTFAFDYTYNPQGHRDTTTYPAATGQAQRMQTQESYLNGFLQSVKDLGANRFVWTAGPMDAEGHVTTETMANGLVTTTSYVPRTGRIQSISTPGMPYTPHLASYTYTANGDVVSRTSRIGGAPYATNTDVTETFTYDGAHRLTSSQVAGQAKLDYAYDALGNMTKMTDTLPNCALTYSATHPHQLSSYTCGSTTSVTTYDARGNTSSYYDGDLFQAHLTYTSFDLLDTMETKCGKTRFTYDADHRRTKKENVSLRCVPPPGAPYTNMWGTTVAIGPFEQRSSTAWWATTDFVNRVVANGRVIAERFWKWNGSSGTQEWHYLHQDALGSLERVSSDTKEPIDWASYDAWGAFRNWIEDGGLVSWTTRFPGIGFAGHDGLWESGYTNLVDMGARQYHSGLHRFLQADTVLQGENRYAYALNNPLRYVDPSGHLAMDRTAIPVQYTCVDCLGGGWGNGIGGGFGGPVTIDSMGNLVTSWTNGDTTTMTALDSSIAQNGGWGSAAATSSVARDVAESNMLPHPSIFEYGLADVGTTPAPAMPSEATAPLQLPTEEITIKEKLPPITPLLEGAEAAAEVWHMGLEHYAEAALHRAWHIYRNTVANELRTWPANITFRPAWLSTPVPSATMRALSVASTGLAVVTAGLQLYEAYEAFEDHDMAKAATHGGLGVFGIGAIAFGSATLGLAAAGGGILVGEYESMVEHAGAQPTPKQLDDMTTGGCFTCLGKR